MKRTKFNALSNTRDQYAWSPEYGRQLIHWCVRVSYLHSNPLPLAYRITYVFRAPSSSSLTFQKPENKYYWYLPVFCMLTTRGTWRRDDNSSRSSIDVLGWTWNERDFSSGLSNFIISHNRYSSSYLNPNKMNSLTFTWYLPVPLDCWWCCMFPLTHCQQLSDEKLPPQGHQLQFPLFPKEMEIIVQNSL